MLDTILLSLASLYLFKNFKFAF